MLFRSGGIEEKRCLRLMIFGFFKKLIKYYIDKLVYWLRMQKFNLELDNDIKKYHEELDKKVKKP